MRNHSSSQTNTVTRAPRAGHHLARRVLAGLKAGDLLERRRSDPEHLAGDRAVARKDHRIRATGMQVEGAGDGIAPDERLPRQQVMPEAAALQCAVYEEQPHRLGYHASSLRGGGRAGRWPDQARSRRGKDKTPQKAVLTVDKPGAVCKVLFA